MPKNKTHKGVAKRVKVSAGGKLMRQQTGLRHRLEKKPSRYTRRQTGVVEVSGRDSRRIRKMLGR